MALSKLAPLLCAVAFTAAAPAEDRDFVAAATTTHFEAVNPNTFTVLLVLGDVAHGARAQMLIAPGASFGTSFPNGTLEGVYMEVVFFSPEGRVKSGAVSFDSMIDWEGLLEIEIVNSEGDAWISTHGCRIPADTGFSLVPACLMSSSAGSTQPLVINPVEVPVLTPTDIETNNIAPKIQGSNPTF